MPDIPPLLIVELLALGVGTAAWRYLFEPGVTELMLVVGTAGAVYPAAGLAQVARQAGARVAIINPAASDLDDVAHALLSGTAASVLPALLAGV